MKDSTSNANNGTSQNMVAGNQVAGKVAGSLNFDGSTTYVDVGTGGSVKGLTQYTISAWGKPAVLDSTKRPIYGEVTPSSGKARAKLLINSTNNFSLEGRANDTDSNTVWVQNATTLSTGTWYYVSAVFDSTSSTNNMHLMVNGVDQTNSISASTISNTTPALSNQIGKTPGSMTEYWHGIIDELRISKTARSADWNKTE